MIFICDFNPQKENKYTYISICGIHQIQVTGINMFSKNNRLCGFMGLLLPFFLLLGLSGCIDNGTEKYKEGVHYKKLSGFDSSNRKQVVLFFSAACPHCKVFDEALLEWEISFNKKEVNFIRVPVTFNKGEWKLLSKMYSVGQLLGAQDVVVKALFKAVQEDKIWWTKEYQVIQWFIDLGYPAQKVADLWNSKESDALMVKYFKSETNYVIRSIPRLIVNGNYELLPKGFDSSDDSLDEAAQDKAVALDLKAGINYLLDK